MHIFVVALCGGLIILLVIALYIKESRSLEQTRKDYIANISHELRSPITTISGLSEALCDGMVSDGDKKRQYILYDPQGKQAPGGAHFRYA